MRLHFAPVYIPNAESGFVRYQEEHVGRPDIVCDEPVWRYRDMQVGRDCRVRVAGDIWGTPLALRLMRLTS